MGQFTQDPPGESSKSPKTHQSGDTLPLGSEISVSETESVTIQANATEIPPAGLSPGSWKDGSTGSRRYTRDSEVNIQLTNDGDFGRRYKTTSGIETREGVSSIVFLHDLGFGAAPTTPEDNFVELGFDGVPEDEFEHSLQQKVEQSLRVSDMDGQEYLPIDAFEAIFGATTITLLVKVTHPELVADEVCKISSRILGKETGQIYRRILGALVLVGKVSYIKTFLDEEISDNDLPIKRDHGDIKSFRTRNGARNTTLFRKWERNDIELFYIYQRMFFVPYFNIQEDELCAYEFDAEIRLPWQTCKPQTSGGNGLVYRIQIHPKHFNFQSTNIKPQPSFDTVDMEIGKPPRKPIYFALKEIFTLDRDAYNQELKALQKSFSQKENEKHLVKLLLTFRHGKRCYLLFEWADGNLEDFWETHKRTSLFSDTWAVKQCLGIATAIKRIHGLTTWQKNQRVQDHLFETKESDWGRHGDIKPRNILWFSSYGDDLHHLVVSDLGLTRFHSQFTRSEVPRSHLDGYTYGYRPPEMDLHGTISQSYDIWSLGCVYLELCLWYVIGIEAIRQFELDREEQDVSEVYHFHEDKYFNIMENGGERKAVLKPIVETVRGYCRVTLTSRVSIGRIRC
jgi:hypothetical protein